MLVGLLAGGVFVRSYAVRQELFAALDLEGPQHVADGCAGLDSCEVTKVLGGGAIAQALRATLKGEDVVIKIDEPSRLTNEAAVMQKLNSEDWSKNLCPRVLHTSQLEGKMRLVMEMLSDKGDCTWKTVRDVSLNKRGEKVKAVGLEDAKTMWASVLRTMQLLKQHGWQHCDLHPGNIMVNNCLDHAELIDWERGTNADGATCKAQSVAGDGANLFQTFGVLFGRKWTKVQSMTSMKNPLDQVDKKLKNDKFVIATARKLADLATEDTAKQAKIFEELLELIEK